MNELSNWRFSYNPATVEATVAKSCDFSLLLSYQKYAMTY